MATPTHAPASSPTRLERLLAHIERVGNRLPDPAMLFLLMLAITWLISAALSTVDFEAIDPRNGSTLVINNLLSGAQLTKFMGDMVQTFVSFHPLGVVLVAMLGIGVAEHVGFISAGLRALLGVTSRVLLTPMLIVVALLSHLAADAGYVLVIPLGAVIFYAAGRHPLAGIAAAFAGVSGGFSASFVPVSLDPLLAGPHAAGRAAAGPCRDRQSAEQLLLHDDLLGADHIAGVVAHRSRDRAAPEAHDGSRRRHERHAEV